MLSWLRRFPHDVTHSKRQGGGSNSNRRASSSTSWRNKSNSFTARIIRCASTVVDVSAGRQQQQDDDDDDQEDDDKSERRLPSSPPPPTGCTTTVDGDGDKQEQDRVVSARAFSFRELAAATDSFRADNLIGEGGFGRVYKGRLVVMAGDEEDMKEVAVKQLDRNGPQGNGEFVVEVLMLSLLHHPNLVNLVGYCADGEQRLLVYPLMPRGSLEDHLLLCHDEDQQEVLPWRTRMRIAHGAARGLEYLHDRAVIFRDLKPSNILLDADYHPRLSDFGLAKLLPPRNESSSSSSSSSSNSSRIMGTYGYCAPEYLRTGRLSAKSDVYSFGVLLLELITGRRAIDTSRPDGEQSLVAWAATLLGQPNRLVDPRLVMAMQSPAASELNQAVGVAAMCLQEHHALRPVMADVVTTLSFLAAPTTNKNDSSSSKSSSSSCIIPKTTKNQ